MYLSISVMKLNDNSGYGACVPHVKKPHNSPKMCTSYFNDVFQTKINPSFLLLETQIFVTRRPHINCFMSVWTKPCPLGPMETEKRGLLERGGIEECGL